MMMTAKDLAFAIDPDARLYGGNWRVRCVGHPDVHPSMDIKDLPSGIVGLVDRSGRCTSRELIARCIELGYWSVPTDRLPPRQSTYDIFLASLQAHPPKNSVPACCLEGPCVHSRAFGREYTIAYLRGNLAKLIDEIISCSGTSIVEETMVRQVRLSIKNRPDIVPAGIEIGVLDGVIVEMARRGCCGVTSELL